MKKNFLSTDADDVANVVGRRETILLNKQGSVHGNSVFTFPPLIKD